GKFMTAFELKRVQISFGEMEPVQMEQHAGIVCSRACLHAREVFAVLVVKKIKTKLVLLGRPVGQVDDTSPVHVFGGFRVLIILARDEFSRASTWNVPTRD